MKMKFYKNFLTVLVVPLFGMILFSGCTRDRVRVPCPPCVGGRDVNAGQSNAPACMQVDQPSLILCGEPRLLSSGQIEESPCLGTGRVPRSDCRPDVVSSGTYAGMYKRTPEVCDPLAWERDNSQMASELGSYQTAFRMCASETTVSPKCRRWRMIQQMGLDRNAHDGNVGLLNVPGNVVVTKQLGYFDMNGSDTDFKKLLAPHHFWCTPGAILARCERNVRTTEPSQDSCVPGVGPVISSIDQGGRGVSGGLGALQNLQNLRPDIAANIDANEIARLAPARREGSAATARMGGGTGTGGGGLGAGGDSGSGGGGAGGFALPQQGAASGAGGGSAAAGSAPTALADNGGGGGGGSDTADKDKQNELNGAGSALGEYASAGGGGGGAGRKSPFGSLGGGSGSGMAVGGASGVGFGKGVAQGTTGPMGGDGTMTDADFEALLQRVGDRSLFDIVNRRYFQWGGNVMREEASRQMKNLSR